MKWIYIFSAAVLLCVNIESNAQSFQKEQKRYNITVICKLFPSEKSEKKTGQSGICSLLSLDSKGGGL